MDPRTSTPASNPPELEAIFWDNIKTTAFFPGIGAGAIPFAAGYALDYPRMKYFDTNTPWAGIAGGAAAAIPAGLAGAAVFSIPFTIAALYTRDFKTNQDIEAAINLVLAFTDQDHQQSIINQIIKNDKQHPWGIRSADSALLFWNLISSSPIEEKWQDLKLYLTSKSDNGAYIHNGKKLFNTILSVTNDIPPLIWLQLATQLNDLAFIKKQAAIRPSLLETRDSKGRMLIHYAVMRKSESTLDYLLTKPAIIHEEIYCPGDPDHKKNALRLASEYKATNFICKLLNAGVTMPGCHPIHIAAEIGDFATVKQLLDDNPELVNLKDENDMTPLMRAASYGQAGIASYLIARNADVNLEIDNPKHQYYQYTALDLADENGNTAIANRLIESGATDRMTVKQKLELKILIEILKNNDNQSGVTLFNKTSPELAIRTYLSSLNLMDPDNVDDLNRNEIKIHVNHLKGLIPKNKASFPRDNKKLLFRFIEKLGQNTDEDLNKLSVFRKNDSANVELNEVLNFKPS